MKKVLLTAVISAMCFFCATSAYAIEPETTIGVAGVMTSEAYEANLINSIAGRAGVGPADATKGIIFEACYAGKQNAKDFFKGAKTVFTKSSTAQQVDLVKMNNGKVVSRIQCKDAPNSVNNVIKQVKSGKYQQAKLVGTTETAEAYNAKAAAKGISKKMTDSGISTKTTSRIADKSLGKISSYANIADYAAKAGALGAAINGGICLVESISNGSDVFTTIGHVTAGAGKGFLASSAAATVGEATTAVVIAAGGTGFVTVAVPVVTAFGVAYLVDQVAEDMISEESISNAAENLVSFAKQSGYVLKDACTDAMSTASTWINK